MRVMHEREDLAYLESLRGKRPLVLVPTMGALHEGHLRLVEIGAGLGPTVVSIFVNPAQFGPNEDFEKYPRDLERDLDLLRPFGVEAVFAPPVPLMYPGGVGVTVQPGDRAAGLCGAGRPGHFAGVLTIVAKLFGLIAPDVAIFGRKDAQQCLVIGQMVQDLEMGIRLIDAPTLREPGGLAMSSRNRYLDSEQRERATCLVESLRAARNLLADGERDAALLRREMERVLEPADSLEYAEVRNVPDLTKPVAVAGTTLLAVAARVGPARLIDNLVLDVSAASVTDGVLLGAD